MPINLVEMGIRECYGRGAEGLPLNPRLGKAKSIVFDPNRPDKAMVKIWTGFHSATLYVTRGTIEPVFLGVDILRAELRVKTGDYVEVSGVGLLGYKPCLTAITETDPRLALLKETLEWARQNPNKTLLDDRDSFKR